MCPVNNCDSTEKDFFVVFPLEHQIRETVLKYDKQIKEYENLIIEKDICDINRGSLAQSITSREQVKFLTLSANEDGAAAFKSTTKKPLYPLFLTINNLPPKLRFDKNNLILGALWFNRGKPDMALFHKNFILQAQKLRDGIQINNENYKIVILQNCLDSVGRCEVFCSKQFNGKYGCTICLHPGKTVKNQIRYPYLQSEVRDDKSTRKIMWQIYKSDSTEPVLGIKGLSVLTGLPDFDIIKGLPPDYMHHTNLGLVKLIWELLFEGDAENKSQPYHIGKQKELVQQRLQSIRLPSSFPRRIRDIEEYSKFKASEWETLLFHCVYPCLHDLLPIKYVEHIMMLSSSIFLLLEMKISRNTITSCGKQLDRFVRDFEQHYGTKNMVYNVHLTTHLAQTVRNLGALWNSSLYPYENGNGMLIGFQTSKNHPVLQVSNKFLLNRICHHSKGTRELPVKNWISKVWNSTHHNVKFNQSNRCFLPDDVDPDGMFRGTEFCDIGKYYYKGIKICGKETCKNFKYDDSFVFLNGMFLRIYRLLLDSKENVYIIGEILTTKKLYENMYTFEYSGNQELICINDSMRVCVYVQISKNGDTECKLNFISICKARTQID